MNPRSYLYVPGDRPQMLSSCLRRGADAVIVDLEDGVGAADKEQARANLTAWLQELSNSPESGERRRMEVWVRVNSETVELAEDLRIIGDTTEVNGIVVPKADEVSLGRFDHLPGDFGLIPLIESPGGVIQLLSIARNSRVTRIGVGLADLVATLGIQPARAAELLEPILIDVVVVSAAAELRSPIAPVSTDLPDLEGLELTTNEFRAMGFGARTAVHPTQVEVINRVFTPSDADVEAARQLVCDAGTASGSAVHVDEQGRMVDEAIVRSARRVLEQAEEYGTR